MSAKLNSPSIILASPNFNAGLAKEIATLHASFEAGGWNVRLLLHAEYEAVVPPDTAALADFVGPGNWSLLQESIRALRGRESQTLLLYNTHPLDPLLIQAFRRRGRFRRVALFLHEPFKEGKRHLGWRDRWKHRTVEAIHRINVHQADVVLVPSPLALDVFKRHFPRARARVHQVRLLIPDDERMAPAHDRQGLLLVGHLNSGRTAEELIGAAEYCAQHCGKHSFQILTASKPPRDIVARAHRTGLVSIQAGRILTDEEIADAIAHSSALLLPHTVAMQSGNIPVALRHGTPIIARDLAGLAQDIQHGQTGIIAGQLKPDEVHAAMVRIEQAQAAFQDSCRADYEARFHPSRWAAMYENIEADLKTKQ